MLRLVESGIEGDGVNREVEATDKSTGLGGAMDAIHPTVFPFNRERAAITHIVEGNDDAFKIYITPANGAELPEAAGVAESGVATKDAHCAIALAPPNILHVGVMDTLTEFTNEADVVNALVGKVTWVVVKTKASMMTHIREGAVGRGDVEGNLRRVNLESKVYLMLVERLKDRFPATGKIVEAGLDILLAGGRESVERMPNR